MLHGLPCVTTDEGGIRDIVIDGKTGYVCPKQDAFSIADAIEKMINGKEILERMGEAGKERLLEKFTDKLFEKRIKEILISNMKNK